MMYAHRLLRLRFWAIFHLYLLIGSCYSFSLNIGFHNHRPSSTRTHNHHHPLSRYYDDDSTQQTAQSQTITTLRASSISRSYIQDALDRFSNIHTDIDTDDKDNESSNQPQSRLPIFDILEQARDSLTSRPNLLLEAPPGAGKTTILPLALLTEGSKWRGNNNDHDAGQDSQGLTNIWVVEPRRVAARSAATRMASILNQSPGQTVGYAVRGDAKISKQQGVTCITVVTDGVLLNRLREDPVLSGIDAIVFDEFHERGVGSDTALALAVEVQRSVRPDLRLVVMSATLFDDSDGESNLFRTLGGDEQCRVLVSDGRMYPIDIQWANTSTSKRGTYPPLGVLMQSRKDLVRTMCDAIEEALRIAPAKGDILAFLPGAKEIELTIKELKTNRLVNNNKAEILPLYGAMPKEKQDYVIFPSPNNNNNNQPRRRRVIVSSPIAEASLTLEGVTCVVDSGLRREARCDLDTGMPRLVTTKCSKASARQRAGRAGRLQEGLCLPLFSQNEYEVKFLDHSPPEIRNTDLLPTLLLLSDWGCSRPADILQDMPFVDPPPEAALHKAYETLVFLQALEKTSNDNDSDGRYILTELGRAIAKLPTHPRLATAIVRAADTSSRETLAAAVIAAFFLDGDDNNVTKGGGGGRRDADLVSRIRTLLLENSSTSFASKSVLQYAGRISDNAREAVLSVMLDISNNPSKIRELTSVVGEALLPGFIDLVAERKGGASYGGSTYMLSLGRSVRLDGVRADYANSHAAPDYIVVAETSTGDDDIARIRSFAGVGIDALHQVATYQEVAFTVPSRGYEVRARRSLMVGSSLELESTPLAKPSAAEVTKILMEVIRSLGGVRTALLQNTMSKKKTIDVEGLRERVRLAASLSNPISEEWPCCFAALDALDHGTATRADTEATERLVEPWLASAGSLKGVDMLQVLQGALSTTQRMQLKRDFPLHIQAPDGTQIPISYNAAGSNGIPTASAKLQQFFGTTESPCVGPPGNGNGNRVPVLLSLLSPAGKLLAQTRDLPFFWRETYPAVRAEMRGRYAKHPWPEDPMNATPTRQTKQRQEQQHQKQLSLSLVKDGDNNEPNNNKKKKKGASNKRGKKR
jgi:ATP-dependent helicase HrpB